MRTHHLSLLLIATVLLAACGTPSAEVEPPTPTPLPADPALERPTYTVTSGAIERVLEVTARATPVDLARLAFQIDGRVDKLAFQRGDSVKAGDVIAELQQEQATDDLARARDDLTQAKRDLVEATKAQAKNIRERELDVERAQTDLARLLPGGETDVLRAAQQKLDDARREAGTTQNDRSWSKTTAEDGLRSKAEALSDAQKALSKARWNLDWVTKYGTHPTERVPSTSDPTKLVPRKLTDDEKAAFQDAFDQADRALRAAQRALEEAQRALDKSRSDEIVENQKAQDKVAEAQRAVDTLLAGKESKEIADARRTLDQAKLALDEAKQKGLNAETRAVENAQRTLDRAQRKVDSGRIIAPQDGQIIALNLEEDATVTAFDPVVEVADVAKLEFSATLTGEQMRQLTEGQPLELRLLTRPDVVIPATVRRMPAPYGSGGSGAVQDRDQTTRIEVLDPRGETFKAGSTLAKARIVLERKEQVLLLPPEAIRTFEGRRFVIVREGERERRVTIRVGIVTEQQVEILDGLKRGDVVVGQ
jgi:multidrug efflux pump subunit AcrA (membrane-fusion protein)